MLNAYDVVIQLKQDKKKIVSVPNLSEQEVGYLLDLFAKK
jgi:hypothetical protein